MSDPLAALAVALSDRYRVERELGRGGMAVVYAAWDLRHDRRVAIKVLRPELARAIGPERFLREIRLTARLTHPHVLPVHDSGLAALDGEAEPRPYYVMPFVEGESLRDRLDRERQLPVPQALRIARDVAAGLAHAHAHGIVHRDVKPENILLEDGEAVVADFGIARALDASASESRTTTGLAFGTPTYMSPEQAAADRELDGRSDVFSLGCVLYEMLVGEPPFTGPTAQVVAARRALEAPPPIRTSRAGVTPEVEALVDRALAKVPADRFASAAEMAEALARAVGTGETPRDTPRDAPRDAPRPVSTPAVPHRRRARGRLAALALAGVAAAAGAAVLLAPREAETLDASLVSVAPFDVLDPSLALWREGMVDLLARSLDGAGPLRTVSPTVVVRRWEGRADPASAEALGRRTGAGLVLFGAVLPDAGDSVRVRAALYDVADRRVLHEMELRSGADRLDHAADSVTLAMLRELGRSRPLGAWRRAGFGTASLPALKAFLRGEQLLRRTEWDSALHYYEQAIALDSAYAPALRRAGLVLGWARTGYDSLSNAYLARAGALNRGLPLRDSLLLASDSLMGSLLAAGPFAVDADPAWWRRLHRLFALLEGAVIQYPDDPEVWYQLGEAHAHLGPFVGRPRVELLEAFDRAIALDSSFGAAYIHAVEASMRRGAQAARRYVDGYLAARPGDRHADGIALVDRVLEDRLPRGPALRDSLAALPDEALVSAWIALGALADSGESALQILRVLMARPAIPWMHRDPRFFRMQLMRGLLVRGHLREAAASQPAEAMLPLFAPVLVEAALLDALPTARAEPLLREVLLGEGPFEALPLRWWAARRDTAALAAIERRGDSLAHARTEPRGRGRAEYLTHAARAYHELARGDTVRAIDLLGRLPDSLCANCYLERFSRGELLAATGRDREAARVLESDLVTSTLAVFPSTVLWTLLRGRVAERLGDRGTALESYGWVAAMWRRADPELQPYVAEARAGLVRLTAEGAD